MSTPDLYDDKLLFNQIAEGNEVAFREVFNRYGSRIYPFILNIVKSEEITKEIVQEVFLRLWLKKETLTEIEKPASWIYRLASNLALTHFRRQKLEEKILSVVQEKLEQDDSTNLQDYNLKELQSLITAATQQLPPKRKQIFILSREHGLSRKEIAEQLNISENTVKNQLVISLKFIQDYIRMSDE